MNCLVFGLIPRKLHTLSGYADVMAGSAVLNPLSLFYTSMKRIMTIAFHNEFFAADAEALLSNSNNYLARSVILNRNAAAMAEYFATEATDPDSPVRQALYPTTSDTRYDYDIFMRRETRELATGHGFLMSSEFEDVATAWTFCDNLQLHCGLHLGGHRTLALSFNTHADGRNAEEAMYHGSINDFEREGCHHR